MFLFMRNSALLLLTLCLAAGAPSTLVWGEDAIVAKDNPVVKDDTAAKEDRAIKTESTRGAESPMVEAVDIPTADILDPSTFATTFRFYREGGITSRLVIGPFR